MWFKKILVFIIGTGISYALINFRKQIHDFTGDFGFAEKYLGIGGTITFFILLAILVFVITVMYLFGTLDSVLQGTFGRLFGI